MATNTTDQHEPYEIGTFKLATRQHMQTAVKRRVAELKIQQRSGSIDQGGPTEEVLQPALAALASTTVTHLLSDTTQVDGLMFPYSEVYIDADEGKWNWEMYERVTTNGDLIRTLRLSSIGNDAGYAALNHRSLVFKKFDNVPIPAHGARTMQVRATFQCITALSSVAVNDAVGTSVGSALVESWLGVIILPITTASTKFISVGNLSRISNSLGGSLQIDAPMGHLITVFSSEFELPLNGSIYAAFELTQFIEGYSSDAYTNAGCSYYYRLISADLIPK